MLEPIIKYCLHFGCALITKKKMWVFIDKLFDQASAFGQPNKVVFNLIP